MPATLHPERELEAGRVRRYTPPEVLRRIEEQIGHNIQFYSAQPPEVISERIEELRREWSIERYLQLNAGGLGLLTALLALTSSRKYAVLTCAALGFFLYHALRGFDPPLPLLRRLGIRTRREINREIFALKTVRGDFTTAPATRQPGPAVRAEDILRAVNA